MCEIGKYSGDRSRIQPLQFSSAGKHHIVEGPASHHTVKGINHQGCEHTEYAQSHPTFFSATKFLIGSHHIALRPTSDDKFRHHQRYADKQHKKHINQEERASAVLSEHVGETPNVPQTHCTARCGQNRPQAGGEAQSVILCHVVKFRFANVHEIAIRNPHNRRFFYLRPTTDRMSVFPVWYSFWKMDTATAVKKILPQAEKKRRNGLPIFF